jgi:hypothetical protein
MNHINWQEFSAIAIAAAAALYLIWRWLPSRWRAWARERGVNLPAPGGCGACGDCGGCAVNASAKQKTIGASAKQKTIGASAKQKTIGASASKAS